MPWRDIGLKGTDAGTPGPASVAKEARPFPSHPIRKTDGPLPTHRANLGRAERHQICSVHCEHVM